MEQSFQWLRRYARHNNMRLTGVAQCIVAGHVAVDEVALLNDEG